MSKTWNDDRYTTLNKEKDTIRDFDDMANSFPQWCQITLVTQADFITLHQSHICV